MHVCPLIAQPRKLQLSAEMLVSYSCRLLDSSMYIGKRALSQRFGGCCSISNAIVMSLAGFSIHEQNIYGPSQAAGFAKLSRRLIFFDKPPPAFTEASISMGSHVAGPTRLYSNVLLGPLPLTAYSKELLPGCMQRCNVCLCCSVTRSTPPVCVYIHSTAWVGNSRRTRIYTSELFLVPTKANWQFAIWLLCVKDIEALYQGPGCKGRPNNSASSAFLLALSSAALRNGKWYDKYAREISVVTSCMCTFDSADTPITR